MLNLYELHKNPKKLEKYKKYNHLITTIIDRAYDIRYNYEVVLHIIKKSPQLAYEYAACIIKGRWEEVEPVIMTSPAFTFYYARDIIKGRWHEAEPDIIKNPWRARDYAENVIKDRWIEAELIIKTNNYQWDLYCRTFKL